jgi:aspartyl-tRNA(Asn)/glutamyl-tRNA(Gln) amidotransferase subunit C
VVDADEVRRIAALARLSLEPQTVETLRVQLASILAFVAMLDDVDVSGVPPTFRTVSEGQPPRADDATPSLGTDRALASAPDAERGHFRVPRVIDP